MALQIKINKKSVSIPTYSELTIKQYKDMLPFISKGNGLDVVRYVSIVTGEDYKKALHFEFKNINRLNEALGSFKFIAGDVERVKDLAYIEGNEPKMYFKHGEYIHNLNLVDIGKVGYRIVLEQFMQSKPNYVELYQFMCALVLCENFDYTAVYDIYESLEAYNAEQVLTIGAFFFRRWKRKEIGDSRLLRLLKQVISTSMLPRNPKLVLIDLTSITT
jgi:hypothetical protein